MPVLLVRKDFVGDSTFDKLKFWVLPVTIKGEKTKHTFNLLLDTGAQRTIIAPFVKRILDLQTNGKSVEGRGVTGSSQYSSATVDLEIGDITLSGRDVLVGDLPGQFTNYKIAGLLGADLLQSFFLKINYPQAQLEIEFYSVVPCPY